MLTSDERLALLAAVDKKVGPALKEAKAEACAQLMERCAEDGTDRRAVTVGGEKVGTVGVSYAKARPVILDAPAAIECLRGMGLTEAGRTPSRRSRGPWSPRTRARPSTGRHGSPRGRRARRCASESRRRC